MKKVITATFAEAEKALKDLGVDIAADPGLEVLFAKKLGNVVELVTPKDGVTKLLNQQYRYGKNWWASNAMDGETEGCTKDNKLEKIKQYVLRSDAYHRLHGDPKTSGKVDKWMAEKFPEVVGVPEAIS